MPVEIKELHVRVTVNQPQQQSQQSNAAPATDGGGSPDDKDAMVSQCVEEVMYIIKNKNER